MAIAMVMAASMGMVKAMVAVKATMVVVGAADTAATVATAAMAAMVAKEATAAMEVTTRTVTTKVTTRQTLLLADPAAHSLQTRAIVQLYRPALALLRRHLSERPGLPRQLAVPTTLRNMRSTMAPTTRTRHTAVTQRKCCAVPFGRNYVYFFAIDVRADTMAYHLVMFSTTSNTTLQHSRPNSNRVP